jgi:hypothetical protein
MAKGKDDKNATFLRPNDEGDVHGFDRFHISRYYNTLMVWESIALHRAMEWCCDCEFGWGSGFELCKSDILVEAPLVLEGVPRKNVSHILGGFSWCWVHGFFADGFLFPG